MSILTVTQVPVQTTNVVSYNAATRTLQVSPPVNVTIGTSATFGGLNSTYSLNGTFTNLAQAINAGYSGVPTLSTDEAGNFTAILNIPSNTFQIGKRVLRIDNRSISSDPTTATTFAEGTFQAGILSTNIGQSTGQPSVDPTATSFTPVNQQSTQVINTNGNASTYDPVAQTFTIPKDNYPNGVFLAQVKLFFAAKPITNDPITVSIVPTINGTPTGQALAYSTVTLNASQVNVNSTPYYTDPTSYTLFEFPAPVYVQSGVPYAIMIQSNASDYQLYFAQQGQIVPNNLLSTAKSSLTGATPASGTATKIGAAPAVGAFFESQNAQIWSGDLTKSLMFVVDQCVFNTSVQPQITFSTPSRLPFRKMGTSDVLHKISPNSIQNRNGNYSPSMAMDAFNVSTTDFTPTGTSINYQYTTTLLNGLSTTSPATVVPGAYGSPMPEHIYLNDGQGERVLLSNAASSFALTATISSSDPNVSPIISDDGVSLYNVRYFINNMGIGNNVITVVNGGTGYNVNTAVVTITSGLNGSTTVSDTGGSIPTFQIIANTTGTILGVTTTNPGSGYLVNPTITISDPTTRSGNSNAVVTITGETSPKGGNAYAKYFTKKVVLNPGTTAGDLRVFFTAYKPVNSQIYVYYRIMSSQDTSTFENLNWQLMTTVSNQSVYSQNRSDLNEYECAPGVFTSNQANNNISYTNSAGQTFNSFTQFAIKVVLATSDNTNVPFLTDIRALALPSGTGL